MLMDAASFPMGSAGMTAGACPRTKSLQQLEGGAVLELDEAVETPRTLDVKPLQTVVLKVLAAGAGSKIEGGELGVISLRAGSAPIVLTPGSVVRISLRGPCRLLAIALPPSLMEEAQRAAGAGTASPAGVVKDRLVDGMLGEPRLLSGPGLPVDDAGPVRRVMRLLAVRLCTIAPRPRGDALPAWRLRRLERYLEDHLAEPVSLADMARVVGLSHFHFARCFKLTLGETPREHLLRLRVERACLLMAAGEVPLAEVAQASGFRTQAHFSNVFRRFAGMSPRNWRSITAGQRGLAP